MCQNWWFINKRRYVRKTLTWGVFPALCSNTLVVQSMSFFFSALWLVCIFFMIFFSRTAPNFFILCLPLGYFVSYIIPIIFSSALPKFCQICEVHLLFYFLNMSPVHGFLFSSVTLKFFFHLVKQLSLVIYFVAPRQFIIFFLVLRRFLFFSHGAQQN